MTFKTGNSVTLILILCSGRISSLAWSPHMVAKYFAAKNVHAVDAIVCSENERRGIFKYFTTTNRGHGVFRSLNDLDVDWSNARSRTGIFIDLSCHKNQQLLFDVNIDSNKKIINKWFTNNFIWLLWDQDGFIMDSNRTLRISTFSDVTIARSIGFFQLSTSASSLPVPYKVGRWNKETQELNLFELNVRINLQNSTIKVAIMPIQDIYNRSIINQQLTDYSYKPDGDVSNRFQYENALHLAYLYNFTLDLVFATNWGDRKDNGTWTGMLGLLQTFEVDMTLSPLLPLSQRLEISYATIPTLPYWMAIIFKQPRALGTYRAMILELSLSSWACLGVIFIFGGIVIALIHRKEPGDFDESEGSIAMGALQSVGILAFQGLTFSSNGTSARIACLCLLILSLIVSTYYSAATMTALLTESPPFIKNLEQLVESKGPLSSLDHPYIKYKQAKRRVFRDIVVNRMETDNVLTVCSPMNCVASILNGSAFLGEYFVLFNAVNTYLQSDAICDLTVFNAGFYMNSMAFLKKCVHFREIHTRGLIRTLEHGLMKKIRKKWIPARITCSKVTEFIHVKLEAVSVALGVFLSGLLVALNVFFLEMVVERIRRAYLKERGKAFSTSSSKTVT